jgi:hypothetical protein
MIDIIFLKSAADIRRKYLKVINNISFYQKKAKEILEILEKSLSDLDHLQKDINNSGNKDAKQSISKLLNIIENVEQEGIKLEKMIDPMNKEIESLSKEENELYRIIKEKYINYDDELIIDEIKKYLNSQGL